MRSLFHQCGCNRGARWLMLVLLAGLAGCCLPAAAQTGRTVDQSIDQTIDQRVERAVDRPAARPATQARVAAGGTTPASPVTASSVAAQDLLDVYALARANDPLLASARAVRGSQAEAAIQARAQLLPQWSAQWSALRDQPGGARTHALSHSLSQVLVDLTRLRTLDEAQLRVSAEDLRVRAAEADLCARVARAYFGVLTAQATLRTAEAIEAVYGQQVAQAQARFEAQLSASLDVAQARAYEALSQSSTAQAREALADAREALAEITGRPTNALRPLAADLAPLPPDPLDPQAWVGRSFQDNPALLAVAQDLSASERRIDALRAAHLPTLSLGLDGDRAGGSGVPVQERGRYTSTLGLRLTIPLFAGGAVESQKRQAVWQREQQRELLEAARRALGRDVLAQHQAVLTALAQMRSTGAAVAAADQALASTRSGLDLGARTMTDLLLAIQTQSNALNAWEQARHRYVLSTLLLQQASGALGETQLAAVNQLLSAARN